MRGAMSITIDLATTEELLVELFSRKTFAGVIVYSPDTHKFPDQRHENFVLRTSCEDVSALLLLESGAKGIRERVREDGS